MADWCPVTSQLLCWATLLTGLLAAVTEKKATFLTATVGEHVVFNCPIDFPHDTEIPYSLRWSKEGHAVFQWYEGVFTTSDSLYYNRINMVPQDSGPSYGRGSVNLTAIRESDSGWYECTVFFPNRKPNTRPNGTWFHLAVEGGTLLAIPPINVTTLEGGRAHFPCVTKDNASVTWFKDGTPLADLSELSARSNVDGEGSLTIADTDMMDSGEFHCVVTNSDGDRQTAGAFLDVQFKAKVVFSPKVVYLPYGRSGTLDCHFRANPPLTNLRWEKDGFLFDPYNVQGVFYKRNGSLFFSKVDEDTSGQYTCTPINDLGTEGASPIVNVVVQRPPVFTVTPHNVYLRKLGETLEMPCDAMDSDLRHHPSIVWFRKDGLALPINRTKITNANLTIEHIQASDRGFYQCVASNEAASITTDTELVIETLAPRAPYNLTASTTSTSVTLRWLPGFLQSNTDYSIWYRALDTPEWRQTRLMTRGTNDVTLEHLSPGRVYEIMVLSQDKHGDGMFSKTLRVETQMTNDAEIINKIPLSSAQHIGPPRNVAANVTLGGYLVHWEAPETLEEELKVYRVQWALGPDEPYLNSVLTTETRLLVAGLEPGTTYHIVVAASGVHSDLEAVGPPLVLHVPSSGGDRAMAVGAAVGCAVLLVAVAVVVYVRHVHGEAPDKG